MMTRINRRALEALARTMGLALLVCLPIPGYSSEASTTIYATAFEADEGYNAANELSGQNGWLSDGSGGNGILFERFPDAGNQGYVGYYPPLEEGEQSFSLWRPVNYDAIAEGRPVVTFSVTMEIVDSTSENRDDFRWSAYNTAGHRLFTLSFNNATTEICYALDDDAGFRPTPYLFENDTLYDLEIEMDFNANEWTAKLGTTVLAEAQPITTTGAALNLGDMDAVWYYLDANAPGDNFMVFDDYRIAAQALPNPSPGLQILECEPNGHTLLRLVGMPDRNYLIEVSENLSDWTALKTASSSDGVIDLLDSPPPGMTFRFYRGRLAD